MDKAINSGVDERCNMCDGEAGLVEVSVSQHYRGEAKAKPAFRLRAYLCSDCQQSLEESIWEMITLK